jgi:hypothetical protein
MRHVLKLHPESVCSTPTHIEVEVARPSAASLVLSYIVTGKMSDIRMPPVMKATRSDELWQHTCFEAFVRASSRAEYYEFNFAPSTQWASYRFSSYRQGRRAASEISAPSIEVQSSHDCLILQASLDLDRMSDLPGGSTWRLGLSAVIEDTSGRKSYWALVHPLGKPDFHQADSFALQLPPATQP